MNAGLAIREFRECQAALPRRRYEALASADRWSYSPLIPMALERAEALLANGWEFGDRPPLRLDPPLDWDRLCRGEDTWVYNLSKWDPIAPLLSAHDRGGERRFLERAAEFAADWSRQHTGIEQGPRFAWYDMTVAFRSYRLAYILDEVCRDDGFDDSIIEELVRCVERHAHVFDDDSRFAAHSNHGFYFAAGELIMARRLVALPEMPARQVRANGRLDRLVQTQFTSEGVHTEHSPDYHRMVLSTLEGLRRGGVFDDDVMARDLIERASESLAWFTMPDGSLAMFGDSPRRDLTANPTADDIDSAALLFVVSRGEEGKPPAETMRAFPESGYAVIREGWPRGPDDFDDWGYLAQTCAFHSRVHKHADDLSFVWYDRGHEILVDPGRYGYGARDKESPLAKEGFYYTDPRRVYVESTRAHNTVEIDGRSYNRREEPPYGSALERWGEHAGIGWTEAAAKHCRSVEHRRMLLYRPGRWLVVLDWITDDDGRRRDAAQHFHLAPELDLEVASGGFQTTLPSGSALHVVTLSGATSLKPARGRERPSLAGWISRTDGRLEPCWTMGFHATGHPVHLATLFTFDDRPLPGETAINDDGTGARLIWHSGKIRHEVTIDRSEPEVTIEHRVAIGPRS